MRSIKVLHDNQWLSLCEMKDPEHDVDGYVFSHETRCGGHIVSILPYRLEGGRREVLLREEVTPCWSVDKKILSSITGGVDLGDGPTETAVRELREEAGYEITSQELRPLGTTFGVKSSDTVYHLFAVDLTWKKRKPASGDGSALEAKASCIWTRNVSDAVDPLVAAAFIRLASRYGYLGLNLGEFS